MFIGRKPRKTTLLDTSEEFEKNKQYEYTIDITICTI